jgi:putative membrane protein
VIELSAAAYLWIKALHVIGVIAWMAGLLYLPRLFVYHAGAAPGAEASETFKVMERRLMVAIMTPAGVLAFVSGALLLFNLGPGAWSAGWVHAKLAGVLGLAVMHSLMERWRRDFAADRNRRPARFFRVANEIPTLLMVGIVILAVVKPF